MGSGFKIGDKVFCCYLNDDDLKREGSFLIEDININSVTLKTNQGLILIPISRVIKIKLQGSNNGY